MLINIGCNVINVGEFQSMNITYTPQEEKTLIDKGWLGIFPTYETKKVDQWTLRFSYYLKGSTALSTYDLGCVDRDQLIEESKKIMKQIKVLDPALINQAFEDAFFKE